MTSTDPFDDLLELENGFYKEGDEAGVADSAYAGLIEGKVFGIEKGFEKALELGRLQGRAMVWSERLSKVQNNSSERPVSQDGSSMNPLQRDLPALPENARLRKHIESLLSLTNPDTMPKDNSDVSVAEFDDRITKSKAKAKMISTMVGESVNPGQPALSGIEDSTGLSARH